MTNRFTRYLPASSTALDYLLGSVLTLESTR